MKFMKIGMMVAFIGSAMAFEISEAQLIEMAKNSETPSLKQIEANYLESQKALAQINDSLAPSLDAGHMYKNTNERAMVPFMPIFSNINTSTVGVSKNFKYGVGASLNVSLDSRSGSSATQKYKDINTVIYSMNFNFDLWQNLFGRMTRNQLENASMSVKNAELQKDVEKNSFVIAVRRLYWQLVSLNEKLILSNALYEQSVEQAKDARRRRTNNIADKSEVAKYESQVFTRKSTVLVLKYQMEATIKQLKNLIPDLMNKDIKLAKYNVQANIDSVLECTIKIAANSTTPYEYTNYDELAKRLAAIEKNQIQIDELGDDVDLKLQTRLFTTGLGSDEVSSGVYQGSNSLANKDLTDNDRSGVEASLQLSIPFGNSSKSVAEVNTVYNQKRIQAQRENMLNDLDATHSQISKSVNLLAQVVKAQRDNSDKLSIRLNEMKKKFNQARISVSDLIIDQDAKMNSDLAIVDSRLAVVNTILDYFTIFNETPCSFNRK